MRLSDRSHVDPFIVMDVMEAAAAAEAAGRSIIHMEVGQPGTPAPKLAREAVVRAMEDGSLGYTVSLGLPQLRARIARHYGERYDVDLNPARVIVTSGSSAGFILGFTALFDPGDRVALGAPGYPSYRQILSALSLQPIDIQTKAENRYQPVPDELPEDVQGLIIASPGNPSGTMLDHAQMSALVEWAASRGASLVSDEIYHGLDYERSSVTALSISDDVYVINSFSKYFSMTGWRVGWMVVPENHVRTIERLSQNMFICAPHASQIAALASFEAGEELEANLAVYRKNRALLIDGLPRIGFDRVAPPDGAFYIYADVSALTEDSAALARDILDKAGVAVTPGLDFDKSRGHQTLRLSYARSTADIQEGLRRLEVYMREAGHIG